MQNVLNYEKIIEIVAIYLRRSRGELEKDLEKHLLRTTEICEQKGWKYVIFKEIGSGDSIEARPVMKELLEDVATGLYDAVVVTAYDRLGRGSGTDQDTIANTFLNSETLIVECNPYNIINVDDESSEDMLAMKQFFARMEYKISTRRLVMGRKSAVQLGRWVSLPPYGYFYNRGTKKLEINETEANVVREHIISKYLTKKYSTHQIASCLNEMNIPSRKNKGWSGNTVLNILKSEVLLGHTVHNKSKGSRKSKSAVKKPFRYIPKSEWKREENTHKPIKTLEEHIQIMEIIAENRKTHTSKPSTNILSGIVKCYNCNSTLAIKKNNEGESTLSKCYKCKENKGGQLQIIYDTIDSTLEALKKHFLTVKNEDTTKKEKEILQKEINQLEEEINTHLKAIDKINTGYDEGFYTYVEAMERKSDRQETIAELEKKIHTSKEKLNTFSAITNKERLKQIEKAQRNLKKNKGNKKEQNIFLKSIIHTIIWKRTTRDEVEVTVNFL